MDKMEKENIEKYEHIKQIQKTYETLLYYHGSKQIKNISEWTNNALLKTFSGNETINEIRTQLLEMFSKESLFLQNKKREQFLEKKIISYSDKLPENQRTVFLESPYLDERLQLIFTPSDMKYTIANRYNFLSAKNATIKKISESERKQHNKKLHEDLIDAVIIDPLRVSETSLEKLKIQLDPDCQNLKEIFKKMRPLIYPDAESKSFAFTIYEYQGKYIVLAGQKIPFKVNEPATSGEKRKYDAKGYMSVYQDIFSLIRREKHILETIKNKKEEYESIKKELLRSISEINWNKKSYSPRIAQNVQEIINQIKNATDATIVAQHIYHLAKIVQRAGENCVHDKQHLEAAMRGFTKRIATLIGIDSRTQLHLLELDDQIEDQRSHFQLFFNQVAMGKSSLALRNYEHRKPSPLKEPFLTFDKQIKKLRQTGKLRDDKILKQVVALQDRTLKAYILEHQLNLGEKTIEEVAEELEGIIPGFHKDMTRKERDQFFARYKNLSILESQIDELLK